jgi:hypothetical protein
MKDAKAACSLIGILLSEFFARFLSPAIDDH